MPRTMTVGLSRAYRLPQRFAAVALPPFRPAALCCAVVPPCEALPVPRWDFSPPCFDAFGEFAIFAARSFDMPLSLSASYCFSFLTCADFSGIGAPMIEVSVAFYPRRYVSKQVLMRPSTQH